MIDYYAPNIDLTLSGCGFLGSYHIGAIYLLRQIWPGKPYNRVCGASCGGLLGALLVSGIKLELVVKSVLDLIRQLRAFLMNPTQITTIKDLIEQHMEKMLPSNAHKLCTGNLGLSLTRVWPFENKFVTEFDSRRDLIDALMAGCFIPLWSGSLISPKYRGVRYLDGAYSNNVPKFALTASEKSAGVRQLEINPFASEVEVSPPDKHGLALVPLMGNRYYLSWANILRSKHAMLPAKASTYLPYVIAGHSDMKDYVLRSNLIRCRHCSAQGLEETNAAAAATAAATAATVPEHHHSGPTNKPCISCLWILEKVDSLRLPAEMIRCYD